MHADLVTDIKAAHEAGFDLIELWKSKLIDFLENNTTSDLKRTLDEASPTRGRSIRSSTSRFVRPRITPR